MRPFLLLKLQIKLDFDLLFFKIQLRLHKKMRKLQLFLSFFF